MVVLEVLNTKDRFFYDIRNRLTDFAGGSLVAFKWSSFKNKI
jgi:hypothetical protein